jgi:hypothetical protein
VPTTASKGTFLKWVDAATLRVALCAKFHPDKTWIEEGRQLRGVRMVAFQDPARHLRSSFRDSKGSVLSTSIMDEWARMRCTEPEVVTSRPKPLWSLCLSSAS